MRHGVADEDEVGEAAVVGAGGEGMKAGMDEELKAWFVREILAHEAALVRYLARAWRNQDDVVDLRQETYARVYESAGKARPVHAKSFLFTTARNLMVDRVRRARIVSIDLVADLEALNVPVDELSPERRTGAMEDLRRVSNALDRLPERCRTVVWLRKVEGLCNDNQDEKGATNRMRKKSC